MITLDEVIPIVVKALDVNKDSVNENTEMDDLLEWDSLGHLTILAALDEELGSKYNESENLAMATSIKDIVKALNTE